MRSPVNTANGHSFKSQRAESFYNFTLLKRPLVRNLDK